MAEQAQEQNLYYEVLTPAHSGTGIIIQEFPNHSRGHVLGVANLRFGTNQDAEIASLGGRPEPTHYGPEPLHEHFVECSWLFPIENKNKVIAFVHRVTDEIERRYSQDGEG